MANIVQFALRLQNQISGPLAAAQRSIQNFIGSTQQAEQSTNRMGNVMSKLGTFAAGAALAVGLASLKIGKDIVAAGASMETTRVRFEALTGSAEKANIAINKISTLATSTPFSKTDLLEYGQQLSGAGLDADQMAKKLSTLGNISSATGKNLGELTSLYIKNRGSGIIQGEDLNQLADAKIPLDLFAKQLGTNVLGLKKLGSQGKLTFEDLDKYFESLGGTQGKWGNMNEKLSHTLEGRWSNLKDTIEQMMSDFGESKVPFFGAVLDKGNQVLNWISNNREKIGSLFNPLIRQGEKLGKVFVNLLKSFGLTGDVTKDLNLIFSKLESTMKFLEPLIDGVGDTLVTIFDTAKLLYGVLDDISIAFTGKGFATNIVERLKEVTVEIKGVLNLIADLKGTGTYVAEVGKNLKQGMKERKDSKNFTELWENSVPMIIKRAMDKSAGVADSVKSQMDHRAENLKRMRQGRPSIEQEYENMKKMYDDNPLRDKFDRFMRPIADKAKSDKMKGTSSSTKLGTKVGDVSGTKITTINLHIDTVQAAKEIKITDLKGQGAGQIQSAITDALLRAINDTSILANQNR